MMTGSVRWETRLTPNAGATADSHADSRSDPRAMCCQRSLEVDSNYSQAWKDLGVRGDGIISGEKYTRPKATNGP